MSTLESTATPEDAVKAARRAAKAAKRAAKADTLSAKTPEQLLAVVAARRERAAGSPVQLAKLDMKEAKIKALAAGSPWVERT